MWWKCNVTLVLYTQSYDIRMFLTLYCTLVRVNCTIHKWENAYVWWIIQRYQSSVRAKL